MAGLLPGSAHAGTCTASAPTWKNFPMTAQSGKFRVDFDAIPSGTTVNGITTLSAASGTTFPAHSILVRFSLDGKIDARNGGSYAASSPIYYQAGKSYHFRLEVDVPAHMYSVYVTPAGAPEISVGTNFAFRTEQNQVQACQLGAFGLNTIPNRTRPVISK